MIVDVSQIFTDRTSIVLLGESRHTRDEHRPFFLGRSVFHQRISIRGRRVVRGPGGEIRGRGVLWDVKVRRKEYLEREEIPSRDYHEGGQRVDILPKLSSTDEVTYTPHLITTFGWGHYRFIFGRSHVPPASRFLGVVRDVGV